VRKVFEPGFTEKGAAIRKLFVNDATLPTDTQTLLLWADRALTHEYLDVLFEEIPDVCVISDRNYVSTYVYQTALMGGGPLNDAIHANVPLMPADVIFILDAPVDVLLKRAKQRADLKGNAFDNYALTNAVALIEGYKRVKELISPDLLGDTEIVYLDATKTTEELVEEVVYYLSHNFTNMDEVPDA